MGKYDFGLELYGDNTIDWIANRIPDNSVVLEFGPANGRLTKYLHEIKKCRVDIVEIDEASGEMAAQYAEQAFLGKDRGDIEKYYWLNENDRKYDFIIFSDVLEHLTRPDKVLERCKAVINEKGNIMVSVPNFSHNSVIIELFNDRFSYNQTGILDNTHVRFFTRSSFGEMAVKAGWMIIEERAKNIRVGETEIHNSYDDVPESLKKELIHRPQGNVYQYMFVLALSSEYLLGKVDRTVSLDSVSFYSTEVQYSNGEEFGYTKSISKHFDPYNGNLKVEFNIFEGNDRALLKLLDCNCILKDLKIRIKTTTGYRVVQELETNGIHLDNYLFFVHQNPEIKVGIREDDLAIEIDAHIAKYDFKDDVLLELLDRLTYEIEHIKKICNDYESELERLEIEHKQTISNICQKYEEEIERREEERRMAEEREQLERQAPCLIKWLKRYK